MATFAKIAILAFTVMSEVTGHFHKNTRFCVPDCVLPTAGRRYCQHVNESASCVVDVKRRIDASVHNGKASAQFACGCFWEDTLMGISGKLTEARFFRSCKLLTSMLCGRFEEDDNKKLIEKTSQKPEGYRTGTTMSPKRIATLKATLEYLLRLQKRIDKLPDGRKKQIASASIVPKIMKTLDLLKKAKQQGGKTKTNIEDSIFSINGHVDRTLIDRRINHTILTNNDASVVSEKGGWNFVSDRNRKLKEKRDREWKLILSASFVSAVVLVIILALCAKIKSDRKDSVILDTVGDLDLGMQKDKRVTCWDTFLEKLRIHYRNKEKMINKDTILHTDYHIPKTFYSETKVQDTTVKKSKSSSSTKLNSSRDRESVHQDQVDSNSDIDEEQKIFQTKLLKSYGTNASNSIEDHVIHHS